MAIDNSRRKSLCLSEIEILSLLDNEGSETELRKSLAHIESCADCRELLALVSHDRLANESQSPLSRSDSARINQDRYVLHREIRSGGMGRIFVAFDRNLGAHVALKSPHEGRENIDRFINEIRLMGNLQHPAIMPIRDAGWLDEDFPFFAMPLVDGSRLDEVAEGSTPEERLRLLRNVSTVVDAVAYAHSQGILHLDIKPQNILIGRFGESILIDWGLGRRIAPDRGPSRSAQGGAAETLARQLETDRNTAGTPAYAAPEQRIGRAVDERADVFGLGTVLYHVLTGTPPSDGKGQRSKPIRSIVPTLPSDLARVVERSIAPDPNDRYARAQDLADDLRRFQSGLLVQAYNYSPFDRVRRFVCRHRATVGVAVFAAVVLGAVVIGSVNSIVRERDLSRAARDREIRERRATLDLGLSLLTDFNHRLRFKGRVEVMDELTEAIVTYLDSVPDVDNQSPFLDAAKQLEMRARMHVLKGDLNQLRGEQTVAADNFKQGLAILDRALQLPLVEADRDRIAYVWSRAMLKRGKALSTLDEHASAIETFQQILKLAEAQLPEAKDQSWLDTLVASEVAYARAQRALGRSQAASDRIRRIVGRFEDLQASGYPIEMGWFEACRLNLRSQLARWATDDRNFETGLALQTKAVNLYQSYVGRLREPPPETRLYVPYGLFHLANVEFEAGRRQLAMKHIRRASDAIARSRDEEPEQIDLLDLHARILSLEVRMGLRSEDVVHSQKFVVSLRRQVAARRPGSLKSQGSLARDLEALLQVLPATQREIYRRSCQEWIATLERIKTLNPSPHTVLDKRIRRARRSCQDSRWAMRLSD
ncbi:MAG: serine/threonine-protein kinase [Myxococcota bacterium]